MRESGVNLGIYGGVFVCGYEVLFCKSEPRFRSIDLRNESNLRLLREHVNELAGERERETQD